MMAQFASTADPSTWASYEVARGYPRIGFVFTSEDPFCGIDLDDCLDPDTGERSLVARVAVRFLSSYTEVSPSGRGIKIIARGSVPGQRRQNRPLGVEMYDAGRFFAITGRKLAGAPTNITTVDLAPLYRWVFGPNDTEIAPVVNTGGCTSRSRASCSRSDEQIVGKALAARNGERFRRLWRGDASGYTSHSEADLALCAMLAYWCEGDALRVEQLFSRSGLCRKKWRERADYRHRTIEWAIATARR